MILIFLTIWAFISSIFFIVFYKEKPIEKLKYYDKDFAGKDEYEKDKKNKISILKILSNLIPVFKINKKQTKKLEIELMKADMSITVKELMVIKILTSTTFAFFIYAFSKNIIITLILFIIIWNMPKIIIANRKKQRIKLFDSQLNEGITIISNSLKAGYSFLQAIAVVTEEMEKPFSKELKKMLKEMSLGISEENALNNLLTRVESQDLKLIVNAILIQKDIGGNLSEILDTISETIRERQKIKNELKTLTAQGKLSGIIVMFIPIFLGAIIYLFNKEYILLLFTTPIGLAMIISSVFNEILGIIIIKKIINIDM
ncbi:type II secretion system F family protein [Haloimpatiens sp. FM7330]|uniref:type II secretion system F family protein n=1 Tax=Haloimpatiens sp. FM7330 TaxID=3298610 RepID=UPI003625CBE6